MTKQQTIERIHQHLNYMDYDTLEGLLRFLETLPKEGDATAHLLSEPANSERLLSAVKNIEARQNIVQKELADLVRD